MRHVLRRPTLAGCLLAAALASLAGTANAQPRLLLRMENVTLSEALDAIGREAGAPLVLNNGWKDPNENAAAEKRATFTWDGVSLGRALRELCETYGYRQQEFGIAAINLVKAPEPAPALPPSPLRAQANGFAISLDSFERRTTHQMVARHHLGEAAPRVTETDTDTATLALTVVPPQGDPDVIQSIENLRIVTDQGPVALSGYPRPGVLQRGGLGPRVLVDDRWEVPVRLDALPAGAKVLTEVSGELVTYRTVTWEHIEAPFPPPALPFEKAAAGCTLTVKRAEAQATGFVVEYEATWPKSTRLMSAVGASTGIPAPTIRLRTGRAMQYGAASTNATTTETHYRWAGRAQYNRREGTDAPEALVWAFAAQSDPTVRIPFRIENVPIPQAPKP